METGGKASIGIIGSGALGSYFGIRLAKAGHSVGFLLRSDYEPVQQRGMRLVLAGDQEVILPSPDIANDPDQLGKRDWVIVGLKTTRNHLFKTLLPPVVGPDTLLITIQNGLGNAEALMELFPDNPVIGALCQIGVNRKAPGEIHSFVPGDGFVQIGAAVGNRGNDYLDVCQEAFEAAGIRTKKTASLGEALWRKLMWNVPFNGLTVAIGGKGTDAVCGNPELRQTAVALMEEIRLAGNALGYPIEPAYTDKLMGFTDQLGSYMASSVLDWLDGRRLEVEAIFRKPLEAGTAVGVDMPELKKLVEKLDQL
ncbi:2-dehydropantoate 2-reductase [Puniceicoccales bacterium CK1056]|uniref:2-dehydropantoate 2-reductase n=1 Tax=Oceanipulchritudo coccoides TaxID=2706888 RepID=A0A6B2M3K9_9BACT|nr:2-dehydropantoate 2-reductase [Oceanipulchritudo coccoides]NDV63343.1 2-dehydropantoate 2-reductase [Oceanipulchritudo coccoides]